MIIETTSMNNNGENNKFKADVLQAGAYGARVVQIINLGIQNRKPYMGKEKTPCTQLRITFELAGVFMKDEHGADVTDKPRWISYNVNFFGLGGDRGQAIDLYNAVRPDMMSNPNKNITDILGGALVVTLNQYTDGQGIQRNGVSNVGSVMMGQQLPELINPTLTFSAHSSTVEEFLALQDWLQEKIKQSHDFPKTNICKELNGGAAQSIAPVQQPVQQEPVQQVQQAPVQQQGFVEEMPQQEYVAPQQPADDFNSVPW